MITKTTFLKGVMNKSVDERLLPQGEYIDALNVRAGSTEDTEIGAIENTKGNELLVSLEYNGEPLLNAQCIGAYEDGARETIYWFVTSSSVDMIVSYNTNTQTTIEHVVSVSVLNFSEEHRINSIDMVEDLLFFTDNYNPPRKINTNPSGNRYPRPVGGVDVLEEDDISVIVKPPLTAPRTKSLISKSKGNYLEDKFVTFAYRWRYLDGEYSALSPFSNAAFLPSIFRIDTSDYTNEGMKNVANSVLVTCETGSKRVTEIQVCFKRSSDNTVYVIDNYTKLSDSEEYLTVEFNNNKIYTLLPQEELFRLYDNVPRLSQAQTFMGNRLMYGNYVDGYNMETTEGGQSVTIDYDVEVISGEAFLFEVDSSTENETYSIDPNNLNIDIVNSKSKFDLDDYFGETLKLEKDFIVTVNMVVGHERYTTTGTAPTDTQSSFFITTVIVLTQDYESLNDMINSSDFANAIGTDSIIQPIADAGDGSTLTDQFNNLCATSQLPSGYSKSGSGRTDVGQAFEFFTSENSILIRLNAMKYTHASDPDIYEYFTLLSNEMVISDSKGLSSLHSNRSYSIGIVYNDEYGRQSTVFTSNNNGVYVSPVNSINQNNIKATINNPPPYWASNYRMAIKPTSGGYDTIYSSLVFENEGFAYFLLEGENTRKVEEGSDLIVKTDSNGPLNSLTQVTALEVEAKESNFLILDDTETSIIQPAGIYMKIRSGTFSIDSDVGNNVLTLESKTNYRGEGYHPVTVVTLIQDDQNGDPIEILQGSKVRVDLYIGYRPKGGKTFFLSKEYVAERNWNNFHSMYVGQNLNFAEDGECTGKPVTNYNCKSFYVNESIIQTTGNPYLEPFNPVYKNTNHLDFVQATGEEQIYMRMRASEPISPYAYGLVWSQGITVTIYQNGSVYTFETKPETVDNDIYYLSSKVYDITDGYHQGGTQNQTASQPAISTLNFFDCYSFGNGVESFKIQDKLSTDRLLIGQQTSAVSEQDYKEAHRFASITYSGVFNAETNLNKLNQFNLALANYKDLEQSFGQIGILHARETDLLTLQEDKISYVLQGKNLLSDSVGGGSIASIPEVLGTQIARPDENGISLDPSSFARYDNNVFFTDAKRGEVLMLKGGSHKNDQLVKISELGMRSYFRDTFISGFHTLKLGAYDPYMDEYVLSFNEGAASPGGEIIYDVACDSELSRTDLITSDVYEVTFEPVIGTVDIDYSIDAGQEAVMTVEWDGSDVINSIISGTGTESFTKTKTYPNTATVRIACEGGNLEDCDAGMDVVFLIDYTTSMGIPIETVKQQVNDIADTIVAQSEGNYRLGLVIFDEATAVPFRYESNPAYTSLPAGQRYIQETNPLLKQAITALELMSTNNADSFKRKVNEMDSGPTYLYPLRGAATDTDVNKLIDSTATFITGNITEGDVIYNTTDSTSATVVSVDSETELTLDADVFVSGESWSYGLQLGWGVSGPEPSDIGLSRIVEHDIAGAFRNNVNKMVILYTDAPPSGDEDTSTIKDADEMRRLASICNTQGIAVSIIGNITQGGGDNFNAYPDTADITGGVRTENFNSNAIKEVIEDICE